MSASSIADYKNDEKFGGSKEAISHHYDIGNDYWRLMLGPSYTYSAAMWMDQSESLEVAQQRKIDWHMTSAGVQNAKSVLEVGCGWGTILTALSEKPAIDRIVGLTLSEAQAELLREKNLPNVEVIVQNWAKFEPKETFDSIISIGAFEHFAKHTETQEQKIMVYRDFFERCKRWLNPGGRLSLQTICFGNMKREDANDFMYTEIYPESDLPYYKDIVEAVDGLFEIVASRNDRLDYARSYDEWYTNLRNRRDEAVQMMGEEEVRRFEKFYKMGSIGMRMNKIGLLRFCLKPITNDWKEAGSPNDSSIWNGLA